jgi:hypothetical protein
MPSLPQRGAKQDGFADHPTVLVTPVHSPGRDRPEWVVAINRNAWSQSIGIGGRNHPVRAPGEADLVDLVFDGHNPLHVYAQAITPVFVKIDVPPTSELYNTFRHSRVMRAVAKGQVYGFNLTATSRLMPTLLECVKIVNARGLQNAPRLVDGMAPPMAEAAPPPPPPVPPITTLAPPPAPEPRPLPGAR